MKVKCDVYNLCVYEFTELPVVWVHGLIDSAVQLSLARYGILIPEKVWSDVKIKNHETEFEMTESENFWNHSEVLWRKMKTAI